MSGGLSDLKVSYALVVGLDGVVVILAFILNPMARRRRAREAALSSIPSGTNTPHSTKEVRVSLPNIEGSGGPQDVTPVGTAFTAQA